MDVLLLSVTDAEGTVLLSTYQTRLVCAIPILHVPWLKPYNNDTYLMYMLQQLEHRLPLTSTMVKLSLVLVFCISLPTHIACDTFLEGLVPLGRCKTLHCDRLHALSTAHSVASQLPEIRIFGNRISENPENPKIRIFRYSDFPDFRKFGKSKNRIKRHRM